MLISCLNFSMRFSVASLLVEASRSSSNISSVNLLSASAGGNQVKVTIKHPSYSCPSFSNRRRRSSSTAAETRSGKCEAFRSLYDGAGLRIASTCIIQPLPSLPIALLMRNETSSLSWSVALALSAPLKKNDAIKEPFLHTITPSSTTAA